MKNFIRAILEAPIMVARLYIRMIHVVLPSVAQALRDRLAGEGANATTNVLHAPGTSQAIAMTFATPNALSQFRADSFANKEPETLEWIEEFGGKGAFYDIGSNVGTYAVYHAKLFPDPVYAFEPSVLNLKLLARNISLNGVEDRVVVVPLPLTASNGVAPFRLSSLDEGGALSSFGVNYGHDGQHLETQMQYEMLGFSLDFLVSCGAISDLPSIIKLDVDGIEHLILSGSMSVLSQPSLRSVLVEVDESFDQQHHEVLRMLSEAGLRFREKRHAEIFDTGRFSRSFNQIWTRE